MSEIRSRMSQHLTRERVRLEAERSARPFAVLVLAIALGVVSMIALAVKLQVTLPWDDPYEVRVAVADATGVVPGSNEVRISGVVVGKIVGVEVDGNRAILRARIDEDHAPLYRDARLRLRPKTPLEDMYLGVEDRGTKQAGRLQAGQVLPAERTRAPVRIGDVLDVFDTDVRPRVAQAITSLGEGLGDRGDDFRAALVEMAPFLQAAGRLTRESAVRGRQTRRLVRNFALLTEELARRDEQVTVLVRSGDGVLGELARTDRPLGTLIEELPPTLRALPRAFATVRSAADDLDTALVALRPPARALPSALTSVRRLAPDLQTSARALRAPLPDLARMARTLPPLATDLQAALTSMRPQVPHLDSATRQVLPCRLAVQKFFHWTVSLGKFYSSHGSVLRGDPIAQATTAAGALKDPDLTSKPDCAKGEPRK